MSKGRKPPIQQSISSFAEPVYSKQQHNARKPRFVREIGKKVPSAVLNQEVSLKNFEKNAPAMTNQQKSDKGSKKSKNDMIEINSSQSFLQPLNQAPSQGEETVSEKQSEQDLHTQ